MLMCSVKLECSRTQTLLSVLDSYAAIWHEFENVTFYCFADGEERTYGGCEGPEAMYVKLISSDGHEFIVKREHALTSGTIKAMLSGPGED